MSLYINPLVNWIWFGFAVMLAGSLMCVGTRKSCRRRRERTSSNVTEAPQSKDARAAAGRSSRRTRC